MLVSVLVSVSVLQAVLKLLLEAGAGLEDRDARNHYTPLMVAAREGAETAVQFLLERVSSLAVLVVVIVVVVVWVVAAVVV